jgi:hypothetical protein
MTSSTKPSAIRVLILVRLLAAGEKGDTPVKIKKDLRSLLDHRWSGTALDDRLDGAIAELEAAGLIQSLPGRTRKSAPKITLTAEGRRQGLGSLGVETLRPKTTWGVLRKTYLPASVLGLPAVSEASFKALSSDPGFRAVLLKREYGLPTADLPKPAAAIDALAWKLIGFEGVTGKFNVKAVKTAVFNRALGDGRTVGFNKAASLLVARQTGARRDDSRELRDAILRRWVDHDGNASSAPPPPFPASSRREGETRLEPPPAGPHPLRFLDRGTSSSAEHASSLDLPALAGRVQAAAKVCTTGRFGDNKVFIAHVWRMLQSDPDFAGMSLEIFKERLAAANHARLLDLSRADLVQAMDLEDVRLSEVHYLNATFHFIRI